VGVRREQGKVAEKLGGCREAVYMIVTKVRWSSRALASSYGNRTISTAKYMKGAQSVWG
jgi:hypothetical protein